ncbi:hypothetical protein HPB48_009260 [Haemaphysalis longicornis]|uniref:Peptidase M13 N-terminal domain-containing protein n=1 Tax=Haemaphysalis longicornis TaxID=44386 RepID=A0A9J6GHS5_HAELO|nr:hypothetical protein HPB48_009260 [Haemaphysalis longicornis]
MGFNRYSWETSSRGSRHSTELSADARSEEDYRRNAFEGAPSDEKIFPQIIIADEGGTSLGDGGTVLEVELVGDDTVDEVHSQHGHMDDDASVYSLQPGEPIELGALLQEEGGNYDLSEAEEDSAEFLPDSPSYTQDEFPTDRGSQRRLSLSRDILQLQNTNYELQARPHAPIRGPDTQDTNFWDLDWPPVLYPESRLVFALALVAGAWVLYLLLTTWRHVDKRSFLDSFRPLTPEINLPHARLLTAPPSLGHFPTEQVGDTEVETRTSAQLQSYQSCGTPNCKREASYPKNLLGENPCLNFYSSICNKQNRDENPAQGSSLSSDALMADNAVKIVADYILDKNHQDMNAARDLVEACINHERDEDWSRAELNELFFEYFGSSWPIENKRPTMEVVWAVAGSLALDIKLEVLARASVQVHPENSSEYIPAIDEPVPLYRDGDFEEPAYSYLLESAVEESFRLTSPAANDGRHASYASGIKRTMQLLSKLSANASSAQPIGPRIYRLSRVRLLLPSVWSFVRAVFLHPSKVADNAAILIKSPRFFENFESAQESQFEPQAILNYIGFRVVVYFAAFLQLPSVRRLRVLEANFMLPDNASAREFCTREMERLFPALYARAFMMQLRNPSVLPSMWSPALKSKFAEGLETVTFVWTSKSATGRRPS